MGIFLYLKFRKFVVQLIKLQTLLYIGVGLVITILIIILWLRLAALQKRLSQKNAEAVRYKMHATIIKEGYAGLLSLIEGQFKERGLVLNHLHDNLGSMLAVLKLNFENLKIRTDGVVLADYSLYDRTDELLDEAYNKVQLLGHSKNEGVFVENNLLPAINSFAERLADISGVAIEVTSFGLSGRTDNDIEVLAFIAIQETLGSVILYSNPSNIYINLRVHEGFINIVVENDGQGFNCSNISQSSLSGLTLMKQKIKRKGGNLTIDGVPGKGATVIINIPI